MKKLILTLLVTCSFAVLNAQTENNDNKQHRHGGNPAERAATPRQLDVHLHVMAGAEQFHQARHRPRLRGRRPEDQGPAL